MYGTHGGLQGGIHGAQPAPQRQFVNGHLDRQEPQNPKPSQWEKKTDNPNKHNPPNLGVDPATSLHRSQNFPKQHAIIITIFA
jgi:hypothetical protein